MEVATKQEKLNLLRYLESGLLTEFGFHHIGIAGHPEGSPDINQETIDQFLNKKFELY